MDNQPNAPKEDEQSSSRPVNRYIRTPTASTTTQSTSSVPGQNQPRETKPPEKLQSMIAEKTTENYTKCIAKYNKFSQTHSSIPVYVMLRKEHLLKEGDEQLGLRNLLHNFAQWLATRCNNWTTATIGQRLGEFAYISYVRTSKSSVQIRFKFWLQKQKRAD